MDEQKTPPLYQQFRKSGALAHSRSGVEAALKTGDDVKNASVTWNVSAASLAGLDPKVGDKMRDTSGVWWAVAGVEAVNAGVVPCLCNKLE